MIKREQVTKFFENREEILKYLQIGTSLSIWPEFQKYILHDFHYFSVKTIILLNKEKVIGHTLIYDNGGNILYFGFFRVIDNDSNKIMYLLDEIIKYAMKNKRKYKLIRGPINIPTFLFGWGFLKEGSKTDEFIAKPVNLPIYQHVFVERGFKTKYEELSFEGRMPYFDPYIIKKYDFSNYEYINPRSKEEFELLFKKKFLELQIENLPNSARITPSASGIFDNYIDYIFKYGYPFMLFIVRFKPTGEIIASGLCLPNPYDKKTIIFYSWVVKREHRGKGITMLMYGATSVQARRAGIRYGSGVVGKGHKASEGIAKILGGAPDRSHLIFEYNI